MIVPKSPNRTSEIDPGADRNEEKAKQQALEGFDVGLELVAELAVRQDHTGKEGAECRGKINQGHQQRYTDNQQQGTRGEDIPQA